MNFPTLIAIQLLRDTCAAFERKHRPQEAAA
jgi:hypothetical protein